MGRRLVPALLVNGSILAAIARVRPVADVSGDHRVQDEDTSILRVIVPSFPCDASSSYFDRAMQRARQRDKLLIYSSLNPARGSARCKYVKSSDTDHQLRDLCSALPSPPHLETRAA